MHQQPASQAPQDDSQALLTTVHDTRPALQDSRPTQDDVQHSQDALHVSQDALQEYQDADGPKRNLLLRDVHTQAPICMRISPTSVKQHRLANNLSREGYKKFQALKACIPEQDIRGTFELGIMHSQGNSYLGFSQDTKGRNREKATDLLNWAKQHSDKFLLTLKTLLPPEWSEDMESRKAPKEWLKGYFERQTELVNAWWTTTTFFENFTGTPHKDPDHQPSFLFNFGTPCYLVLHDYNITVKLEHLDVAIFNTNTVEHSTQAVDREEGTRWAFSAFFQKGIYQKKGPSQLSKDLLDRVLGPAQAPKRVRGANK